MGTHPIFESDFDCLTDCLIQWSAYHGPLKKYRTNNQSKMDGLGAGFLFGNVDEHGRLESDVFNDDEKKQLRGLSSMGVTGLIEEYDKEAKKLVDDDDFDMVPQSPMAVDYSQIDSEAEDFDEIKTEKSSKPNSTRRKSSGSCDIILPSCAPSSGDIILPSIGGNSELSSRDSVSETPDGSKKPKDKKKKRKEYSEQDKLVKTFQKT